MFHDLLIFDVWHPYPTFSNPDYSKLPVVIVEDMAVFCAMFFNFKYLHYDTLHHKKYFCDVKFSNFQC